MNQDITDDTSKAAALPMFLRHPDNHSNTDVWPFVWNSLNSEAWLFSLTFTRNSFLCKDEEHKHVHVSLQNKNDLLPLDMERAEAAKK